jgi:hypothetical protein
MLMRFVAARGSGGELTISGFSAESRGEIQPGNRS